MYANVVTTEHAVDAMDNTSTTAHTEDDDDDDDDDAILVVHHSTDLALLSTFCLLTCCNQALWISFASVKDDVEIYFQLTDPLLVDLLSNIYMIIFLVLFLPTTFFLNKYGLKNGIVLSALLNASGAVLRYLFALNVSFAGCVFGQSLCAVSQVLNFCCVGALASSVVKPDLKTRAVGLIWFSTYFGCALGLWIPPMAVGDSSDDLIPCLLGFGIAATVVGVCVVASVCRGAQQQQQNVRVIVSNHNTILHIEYACVTIGKY